MATFQADCPHCGTKRVGFIIACEQSCTKQNPALWDTLAMCGGCGRGVVATFDTRDPGFGPSQCLDHGLADRLYLVSIHPEPPNTAAPEHTPDNIATFFVEGKECQFNGNWNAAVVMFRKTLEVTLRTKFPDTKGRLYDRIVQAAKQNKLTPELAEWAHHIRILGANAAHEDDPFLEEDTHDAANFTNLILQYLYTLPGDLEAARNRTAG